VATNVQQVYARPVAQPRSRLEVRAWQFMRLSGVLLIPLAFGHLAMMHIINNVHVTVLGEEMNAEFVAWRWGMLGWRVYDALLLGLAWIHGLNGFRYVVDDYVHNPKWNRALKYAIIIGGLIIFLIGAIALIGGVRQA
jgi:succinate dehydrogenase / fumarate reductase membrane anchor subunit